jgi:Uma2 family endonuclease
MALAEVTKTTKKLVTSEVLWNMGAEGEQYELVKGELVEMTPPGGIHGSMAIELGSLLQNFVKQRKLGKVMVESGYLLATNPDTVRGPDISFLAASKISPEGLPDGYIHHAPDLAVAIVSPSDTASIIQDKVQDYLTYGTRLVWVVYPQQKIVVAHYPDGTAKTLRKTDSLTGEDVLPDFSCPVADLFS